MKRLIVAVALALSAAPALADTNGPFEQNELDRQLPALPDNVAVYERSDSSRAAMPFEQTQFDRGDFATPEHVKVAQIGGTSYKSGQSGESPWAMDHNFIAPPQ
jgi:hypothetical protein